MLDGETGPAMANWVGREALRGEEVKTLDFIAEDAPEHQRNGQSS